MGAPLTRIPLDDIKVTYTAGMRVVPRRFERGQILPVHTHPTEDLNHITVVLSGSMRCKGRPEIEGDVIRAGEAYAWNVGEAHGFEALEDGTVILQIGKDTRT